MATKAVFNVDNYRTFLSIQCDSTIRKITRLYPYDLNDFFAGSDNSGSLLFLEHCSSNFFSIGKVVNLFKKKVSLKTMTLNNKQQKVNDALGNPGSRRT